MGRLDVISIKIDKNDGEWSREWHWGQQVGGMFGQLMVEGDGSPGWVVITRLGVCMCENRKIGEKSIKFDEYRLKCLKSGVMSAFKGQADAMHRLNTPLQSKT